MLVARECEAPLFLVAGDYNDYDEVTIPPNLTDLLANLPDDISSDSIQKMLRCGLRNV